MHSVRRSQLPVASAVGMTVLCVPVRALNFTGEAYAPAAAHTGPAAVVRHGVAQHRNIKRMQAQPFGGGLQQSGIRDWAAAAAWAAACGGAL